MAPNTQASAARDEHKRHVAGRSSAEVAKGASADLFPRLSAMRQMIGARSFAIFSCSATGKRAAANLVPVLDDCSPDQPNLPRIVAGASRILHAHMDRSSLPIVWNRGFRPAVVCAPDCRHLVAHVPLDAATGCGIGFPVRLGAVGNGLVMFEAETLHLSASQIFSLHRMAYRVMTDLLEVEMKKAAPRQTLSNREIACLQCAGDGFKSEAIANRLGLSVHTVNAYLSAAAAKLDSVNRIQAIAKAIRLGVIA